ncbi:hypothetical protein ACQPXT_01425 [Streptomyces sp. CA-100214]|uniref:hypothetical protein n=1 Tax=Streptomyces sp. NPDC015408 TaxID=3364956 RepID=UPI0036FD94AB
MDVRAVDLPELRAELAVFTESEEGVVYWAEHATTVSYYQSTRTNSQELGRVVRMALHGDLYAVSGSMAELAATAGQSLDLFDMDVHDLPTPTGVLIFEQPPQLLQGPDLDGEPVRIHGATWAAGDDGEGGYVWITPIAEQAGHSHLMLGGPVLIPFAMADYLASVGRVGHLTREKNLFDYLITTLRAVWLLMQQPVTEETELQPDRAVRKRLRRVGREPASVRLITLRRPKCGNGQGDGDREYHHQWIVRGHWRQQWYPARQVHRPVWIAPHVKGPEGAPLIGGEKVNVLKR